MAIMKRTTQTKAAQTKTAQTTSGELGQSLTFAATHSVKSVCRKFPFTTPDGLAIDIAQAKYDLDGPNVITSAADGALPHPPAQKLCKPLHLHFDCPRRHFLRH